MSMTDGYKNLRSLIGTPELDKALEDLSVIVKSLEHFEKNFEKIMKEPPELIFLLSSGYFTSLGSLIKNDMGLDYTSVMEIFKMSLEEDKGKFNDMGTFNPLSMIMEAQKTAYNDLREWEKGLKPHMEVVLSMREGRYANINFCDKDFLRDYFKRIQKEEGTTSLTQFLSGMINMLISYFKMVSRDWSNKGGFPFL